MGVTGELGWTVSSGSENERLEPAPVVNGAEEVEVGRGCRVGEADREAWYSKHRQTLSFSLESPLSDERAPSFL